jgi:hypothetical protein
MQFGTTAAAAAPDSKPPVTVDDPTTQEFVETVGAQVIDNQEALTVFRAWMIEQPGFAGSGYVGSIDDLPNKGTAIMWYGPRTTLLDAIMKEGARRGIAVSVQPRAHSVPQINAAVDAIWQQAAVGDWAGFTIGAIAAIGATDDGLTVYGTYTSAPAEQRAPQVRSLATTVMDIPVRVVPGVNVSPSLGRSTDFSPFFAGGYMLSPSANGVCSTGFAIRLNNVNRITTARHCDRNDYRARAGTATYGTGLLNSGNGGGRVLTGAGAARAFDGAFDTENFTKAVIGFQDMAINNFVCTDGGNSGVHCNVRVTNLSVSFNDGFGTFTTIQGVQQTSGAIAVIQGDSGGPVISLAGTVDGQVRAAGMIQGLIGGTTGAACGRVFDGGGNLCSATVLFSSMRTIVNSISGATLLTG